MDKIATKIIANEAIKLIPEAYEAVIKGENQEQSINEGINKNNVVNSGKESSKQGINTKISFYVAAQDVKDRGDGNNINREKEALNIKDLST